MSQLTIQGIETRDFGSRDDGLTHGKQNGNYLLVLG